MCILNVYPSLKDVSNYDLNVLFMSVMGFQNSLDTRAGGWCELYPVLGWIF